MTRRQHSAAGHAAAGRYYAERGLRPVTRDCRAPTNDERLARYYAHPVALKRRPLVAHRWPTLSAPSHEHTPPPCGEGGGSTQRRSQATARKCNAAPGLRSGTYDPGHYTGPFLLPWEL